MIEVLDLLTSRNLQGVRWMSLEKDKLFSLPKVVVGHGPGDFWDVMVIFNYLSRQLRMRCL